MGVSLATIPALANAIKKWVPELNNRVIAVADAEVTKENMPTLPICMIALLKADPHPKWNTRDKPAMVEHIAVQFWFAPVRDKRQDGSESPFYSFYDYDMLARKVLPQAANWRSPRNERLISRGFDIEATPFAIIINFTFTHEFYVCADGEEPEDFCDGNDPFADGQPLAICATSVTICEDQ